MKIRHILYIATASLLTLSCGERTVEPELEDRILLLEGSATGMFFAREGSVVNYKFVASKPWKIEIDSPWLSVSRTSAAAGTYTVKFTAAGNDSREDRTAKAVIRAGSASVEISAAQDARAGVYKVIAHRCGFLENGCAQNSLKSLEATIATRCYGAEVDVMWTADDDVVICHPDGSYKVNGLDPTEHTLAEIRAAGKLSDGSEMPSLGDFLEVVSDRGRNPYGTKLWLDIKGKSTEFQERVMERSAEIAKSYDAGRLVEFLVPGGYPAYIEMKTRMACDYGIACAWNGKVVDYTMYGSNGWGQMPFGTYNSGNANWPPTKYTDNGVTVSIYHTPSSVGSYGDLYYYVVPYYKNLKAIFVNHPQALIDELIKQGVEDRIE